MGWRTPSWSPAALPTDDAAHAEESAPAIKVEVPAELPTKPREIFVERLEAIFVAPKRYQVPPPSDPARTGGTIRGAKWLWLPGGLLVLGAAMATMQHFRQQQRELAASQLQLAETQQAFYALQLKPDSTAALEARLHEQSQQLTAFQRKLQDTERGLRSTSEQATAREQDLQRLVAFLKDEIKASEAQINDLKQMLKARVEIKKAE
jgi:uncharacterized protein HemX